MDEDDKPAIHEVRVGCGPFMALVLALIVAHIICRALIDPAMLWLGLKIAAGH